MRPKLLDILSHKELPIDNEQLAKYLKDELNDAQRHEIEKKLQAGDTMEQDAWEGWHQAGASNVLQSAEEINKSLEKQLQQNPRRERKRPITELPVIWWVFGLILVIIFLAWVIIQYYL